MGFNESQVCCSQHIKEELCLLTFRVSEVHATAEPQMLSLVIYMLNENINNCESVC